MGANMNSHIHLAAILLLRASASPTQIAGNAGAGDNPAKQLPKISDRPLSRLESIPRGFYRYLIARRQLKICIGFGPLLSLPRTMQ
jgi:hypothetical protein